MTMDGFSPAILSAWGGARCAGDGRCGSPGPRDNQGGLQRPRLEKTGATPAAIGPPETDEIGATAKDHAICASERSPAACPTWAQKGFRIQRNLRQRLLGVLLACLTVSLPCRRRGRGAAFHPRPPVNGQPPTASACRMRQIAACSSAMTAGGSGRLNELRCRWVRTCRSP